jgi:riboflavin kinase / FMN adenylyltransferase
MQVHRSIDQLPRFQNSVITIGTFDGVHQGHQQIIEALKAEAQAVNGEAVIITFDPHPRKIVHPHTHLHLINTLEEKIELFSRTGIDHLVVVPFTKEFSDQPAEEYIENFLIGKFQPHSIIIGYDHHFGHERKGNFRLLENNAQHFNYKLLEIPKHVLDSIAVSSTKIRKAIQESHIETANKLLGYDFFFEGKVIHGDKLGRQLGYPTANLEYTSKEKIHLGHGVFAVHVEIEGETKKGMLSIGDRPTLNRQGEKVEVNIFDFAQDIYGKVMRVIIRKFLREQVKYNSLDELIEQLHKDKENSLAAL